MYNPECVDRFGRDGLMNQRYLCPSEHHPLPGKLARLVERAGDSGPQSGAGNRSRCAHRSVHVDTDPFQRTKARGAGTSSKTDTLESGDRHPRHSLGAIIPRCLSHVNLACPSRQGHSTPHPVVPHHQTPLCAPSWAYLGTPRGNGRSCCPRRAHVPWPCAGLGP